MFFSVFFSFPKQTLGSKRNVQLNHPRLFPLLLLITEPQTKRTIFRINFPDDAHRVHRLVIFKFDRVPEGDISMGIAFIEEQTNKRVYFPSVDERAFYYH